MATRRYAIAAQEWGPVGLCAAVVFAALVYVGITACAVGPIVGGVLITEERSGRSSGGGPEPDVPGRVYLGHDSADAPYGISTVEEIVQRVGDIWVISCRVGNAFLPNTPVRDLELVTLEFEDGNIETRLYALSPAPGAAALIVIGQLGSEIARVPLPFTPKSFDVSPSARKAFVVEENGHSVARVDLATNTVDATAVPMNGLSPALRHPFDVRVIPRPGVGDDEVWIGEREVGVVILDQSMTFSGYVGLGAPLSAGFDHLPESTIVDAITDHGLWEIDIASRTSTRVAAITNGKTLSSAESDVEVEFTAANPTLEVFSRAVGTTSVDGVRSLPPGLVPASQLTLQGQSFLALRDGTGAGSVACPDVDELVPTAVNPSAFARSRFIGNFPNPPAPPDTVTITVNTSPDALSFEVDGQLFVGSASFEWVPGSNHQLNAPTQGADGTRHRFLNWLDGDLNSSRVVTTPPAATTYTARFALEHQLTVNASSVGGTFVVTPASTTMDGYYAAATPVSVTAIPDPGYTATLTGFDSVIKATGTVTLNSPRTVTVTFAQAPGGNAVSFTTAGTFLCTNTPTLTGCGTASLRYRAILMTFVPANRTETLSIVTPTVLGEVIVACVNGVLGDCGESNFANAPVTLEMTLNQTAPFAFNTEFQSPGTISGAVSGETSTATLSWPSGSGVAQTFEPGRTLDYVIDPVPFPLVPPSSNTCGAPCPLPTPASRALITARIVVVQN